MPITASQVLSTAKSLLNDPNGNIYPDDKVIPLVQKAYGELQIKMMLNGLPVLKEQSAVVQVNIGTVVLGDGSGLPSDFIYPIELSEKARNSSLQYEKMEELEWEPDQLATTKLLYWNWREEELKFLGATTDRDVRIRYMKGLTRVTATSTPISINNAETFLSARTAELAAFHLGSNPTRAAALAPDAKEALDNLIALLTRRQQGLPVRRRVNRYRR